jgi:hypothetical protein
MDSDLLLTLGIVLIVLTLPSLLSAWTEGRPPRIGAIMLIAATVMIVVAVTGRPGGYAFNEVPHTMLTVFSRFVN